MPMLRQLKLNSKNRTDNIHLACIMHLTSTAYFKEEIIINYKKKYVLKTY